jgi:hypothetical protein
MYDTVSIINTKKLHDLRVASQLSAMILADFNNLLHIVALSDRLKQDADKTLPDNDQHLYISTIKQYTQALINVGSLQKTTKGPDNEKT